MKKTLGGDRLGSGKKMQIELHNYERSTHDLGYLWRSTMSAGTLVPFMKQLALPGDTFDIELDCDIKTLPTIGPLFGSYKVQLDVFQAPIRLYNSLLHNNALGIGLDMSKVKLPVIELWANMTSDAQDIDNAQINPSCILSYLGIRGVGLNQSEEHQKRQFNAVPLLAYWDIYKNYYANKQEEIGAVVHSNGIVIPNNVPDNAFNTKVGDSTLGVSKAPLTDSTPWYAENVMTCDYTTGDVPDSRAMFFNTTLGRFSLAELASEINVDEANQRITYTLNWGRFGDPLIITNWDFINNNDLVPGAPEVATFELANIDHMRNDILAFQSTTTPFKVELREPYMWLNTANQNPPIMSSQEGLALKTYQSDLFNNWLSTEWIDGTNGISAVTAISTAGDSFTLDTLNLAKKVYDMLNRIAVSGGTYDDWLDAVYAHDRYVRAETPMYMGGLSKELVFQEVISNAEAEGQPLGTLAGRGVMSNKHKGGKVVVKVDEPSYIIGIASLTPRLDYSQGNDFDVNLKTLDDLHKPQLDEIGFQDLITEQMAWWDTYWDQVNEVWVQKSAGKQPAWINYMTNVNQTRGNFAVKDNQMFMTLNRRYEFEADTIKDLTTYIDPGKFNFIFAQTSLDAQNFWAQIAVDITARRKMSAKVMPNL